MDSCSQLMSLLLMIGGVVFLYFHLKYVMEVNKMCDLSVQNKQFGEVYLYFLLASIMWPMVSGVVMNVLNLGKTSVYYINVVVALGMVALNYYLLQYVNESQEKCQMNKQLHQYGEFLWFFVLLALLSSAGAGVNTLYGLAKRFKLVK